MSGKTPRLLLAAPGSGSGKTLITCGLLAAWKKKGLKLASFKCGPDYIDTMFHRSVLSLESRNLDSFFTDRETLRYLLERGAKDAELSVIEGVMGYFDGLGGITGKASTSEVAALTDTPAVLIVNCWGVSRSAVPLIKGFLDYEEQKQLRGVILNQVSPMLYPRMKELIGKRSASQPLDLPSAGSAFKRPVGGYAAALIEQAGLKGFRVGNAGISEKHAGFAVNLGGAIAKDVKELLQTVSERVYEQSGIRLEPEIRIW